MSAITIIITHEGIIVADAGVASQQLLQRLEGAIASGEASALVINQADNAAPIIEGALNAQTAVTLSENIVSGNLNATIRDSFAALLGTLAGIGALPVGGPAAAVAADAAMSAAFTTAYDAASGWSQNQDWSSLFDQFDSLKNEFSEFGKDLFDDFRDFILDFDNTLNNIGDAISDFFDQARRWRPRSGDPLVLDLDGDGIETVAANGTVLFDHDGDSVKHGTGWVGGDDGFLVLDKNGNGRIDNGAELFGVDTVKTNGRKALDGFDALRDLDSNTDGVFDANDTRFNDVRVWRDLNQDGVSQASELKTLAEHNIAVIDLNATPTPVNLGNNNRLTHTALYTRTDGTTGTVANLIPAANPFYREYTDAIPLSAEVQALPDMKGSGAVRDLREAAMGSNELRSTLTAYTTATTHAAQQSLLDSVIEAWADGASFKGSVETAQQRDIKLVYLAPDQSISDYEVAHRIGLPPFLTPEQRARIATLEVQRLALVERITLLETFNGQSFVDFTADNKVRTGAGVALTGGGDGGGGGAAAPTSVSIYVSLGQAQANLFDQSYAALRQSVYDSLITQTRLKPYLEAISLTLTSAGEIGLDFSGIQALYDANKATDAKNALIDLLELQRHAGSALMGMGFNTGEIGLADMTAWRDDPEIKGLLAAANVRFDNATDGTPLYDGYFTDDTLIAREAGSSLWAGGGNDALFGRAGKDNLSSGQGDDRLYGGAGNDFLAGGAGSDVYIFSRGFGRDNLWNAPLNGGYDASDVDRVQFTGDIRPDEVRLERVSAGSWDHQISDLHITVGDDRIIVSGFFALEGDDVHRIDEIRFADGTVWKEADILLKVLAPTSDDDRRMGYASADVIHGDAGNDRLEGRGGDDTLHGEDGDDALDGGAGNDLLYGGAGKDVLYGQDGNDTLSGGNDSDTLHGNEGNDVLQGGDGADTLYGGAGDDVLEGGLGDDALYGGSGLWDGQGNDTYVFGRGYGRDTVFDTDATPGNTDTVRLNADVAPGDVRLKRMDDDLVLDLSGTADSLTVKNWFAEAGEGVLLTQHRVERIEFAPSAGSGQAGMLWDAAEILRQTLIGTEGNDALRGYATDDALTGGAGDDTLQGLAGSDTLDGGAGSDRLMGGSGDDTYRFGRGDGRDVAEEQESAVTLGNRVVFNADVASADVVVRKSGNDITLTLKGTADQLTLRNAALYVEGSAFGSVSFADGTVWDYETLKSLAITSTDGDDRIEGFDGRTEIFDGGVGNDVIEGGSGGDVYRFGRGDGQDVVWDYDVDSSTVDTLEFKAGVLPPDVLLTRDGQDLVARIVDSGDQVTLKGWFDPYGNTLIERIGFADGTRWDASTVRALVGVAPDETYLFGTPAADTLTGGGANNFIFGQEGNDLLSGGDGDDTLDGGDGDDTLLGGAGVDVLNGGQGLDYLNGGAGDDYLNGGDDLGNTYVIEPGDGFDTLEVAPVWAGAGEDVVRFGPGITPADLRVQVTAFNDGGDYGGDFRADNFSGEVPGGIGGGGLRNNVKMAIGTGTNEGVLIEVYGSSGYYGPNDFGVRRFVFANGTELTLDDILAMADGGVIGAQSGTEDDDSWLFGSVANDTIHGLAGDDRIEARDNEDVIFGGDGDDVISAGSGEDRVYGDAGDDVLAGGRGNDTLRGGAGKDVIVFNRGDGHDRLDAADGDAVSFGVGILPGEVFAYRNRDGDLVLRLNDGADGTLTIHGGLLEMGGDAALPVQHVQFIDADGQARVFDLAGALTDQAARLETSDAQNPIQLLVGVDREITGRVTVAGGAYAVVYAQTGNLFGTPYYASPATPSAGNDLLTGTPNPDVIDAGAGDDLVNGGAGDDAISGGTGNDVLEGAGGNDVLEGGAGNDALFGGTGNDTLNGGIGFDAATGGAGDDTYIFNAGDGEFTINDTADWQQENRLLFGPGITPAALKLSHDAGYLVIQSGATGDVVRLSGFDSRDALGVRAVEWFEFDNGTVLSYNDLLARGFDIGGSVVEDLLLGTNLADRIEGKEGADALDGGQGDDTLSGGAGSDEYVFNLGDGADTLIDGIAPGETTTLRFGTGIVPGSLYLIHENGGYVLRYGSGGDSIRFAANGATVPFTSAVLEGGISLSFETLTAGGLDITGTPDVDSLAGTPGSDRINGLAGDDTLAGGGGFDIYTVAAAGGVDTIIDQSAPGEENLLIFSGLAFTPDQIRLVSNGQAGFLTAEIAGETRAVRLSGFYPENALNVGAVGFFQLGDGGPIHTYAELAANGFQVVGTTEDDVLQGTAFFDRLEGRAGSDHLRGGPGDDIAEGGAGDDHYYYNRGDGLLTLRDEISLVPENTLHFGPGITLDNIRNNLRFEAPVSGSPGTLIINVDADGNGIRIEGFDPANAATGAHAVEYFAFADGTTLNYAELVRNTFVIQGDGANNVLTGTNIGDRLYGYGGEDTLSGGAGGDTLTGGIGADLLQGGDGDDVYVFNRGDGLDTILDSGARDFNYLLFGPDILAGDVSYVWQGSTLVLNYGVGDAVRIPDFDLTGINGSPVVVALEFDDGTILSLAELLNRAPIIGEVVAAPEAVEDSEYLFTVPVTAFADTDAGDRLSYVARLSNGDPLPGWLTFNSPIRTFTGIPGNQHVGSLDIALEARDLHGLSATQTFRIQVRNVNDAPVVVNAIADQAATEDTAFSFTVPADAFADVDADDSLSYAATLADGSALPSWLSFDAVTHTFSGTPGNGDVGNVNLKIMVTDLAGSSVSSLFVVAVANTNDAPMVLHPILPRTAFEDTLFSYTLPDNVFVDVDAGDSLAYSATLADGSQLPYWLTFDAVARAFSGMPGNAEVGNLAISILATDQVGASASAIFNLTIENVNDAPVMVNPIPPQTMLEDEAFTYTLPGNVFADIDIGDSLAYSATLADGNPLPSWLAFDTGSLTFSGIPGNAQVGNLVISVIATDQAGASAATAFDLSILNVNDAPVVGTPIPDQNAKQGQAYQYTLSTNTFTDADVGDSLTYTATLENGEPLPAWLAFDAVSRTFIGTPGGGDIRNFSIKVTATDQARAQVSDSFMLKVNPGYNEINGTSGWDLLIGTAGNDRIDGKAGVDIMAGLGGDDLYIVDNPLDIVLELPGGGVDTVEASVKYSLPWFVENLTLTGSNAINGTGNNLNNILNGNDTANTLTGLGGSDTLIGGRGNDKLIGGTGNDLYLFGRGDGADTLVDFDLTSGNTDTLRFALDISPDQLWFARAGNDLSISVMGSQDKMTVSNWYLGSAHRIERIEAGSGKTLLDSQVASLVNAMASFGPPAAGQITLPTAYQADLNPVIAANWQ